MAKSYVRLPNNVALIKKKIIENNDYSSHEVNDAILSEIKRQFQNVVELETKRGKTIVKICLNHKESKIMDEITEMYGITFTQLYINAIINIGKQEKII